jgi:hypothetical protein
MSFVILIIINLREGASLRNYDSSPQRSSPKDIIGTRSVGKGGDEERASEEQVCITRRAQTPANSFPPKPRAGA